MVSDIHCVDGWKEYQIDTSTYNTDKVLSAPTRLSGKAKIAFESAEHPEQSRKILHASEKARS